MFPSGKYTCEVLTRSRDGLRTRSADWLASALPAQPDVNIPNAYGGFDVCVLPLSTRQSLTEESPRSLPTASLS